MIAFDGAPRPLSRRAAAVTAAGLGLLAALLVLALMWRYPERPADIDQVWFAARALLEGRNPYELIGPGREFDWPWAFYYPLPAAVIAAPLAPLPLGVTRVVFGAVPVALLAYLMARRDWRWLAIFASRSVVITVLLSQWTVLLMLALFAPVAGIFWGAKPNIALALSGAIHGWRAFRRVVTLAMVPVAISVLWQPTWALDWFTAIQSGEHLRPAVVFPGGFLVLLALLRWRRWEARLLLGMACVPMTVSVLSVAPLLLIARTFRSLLILCFLTYVPFYAVQLFPGAGAQLLQWRMFSSATDVTATIVILSVYLPALGLVLMRPNEGIAPASLEAALRRAPRWLRGQSTDPMVEG